MFKRFTANAVRAGRRLAICAAVLGCPAWIAAQDRNPPIVHKIHGTEDRIEMTANTSRILELNKKIPRAQVNNPDILDLKAIGPNQVQIHSLKPGITQVNLWDEANQIHAIDVVIYADVKELSNLLKSQFPKASVMVVPTSNSVILQGFVDQPETVEKIMEISQDYYPRVINNMIIGGGQQVMLHVKVMEVSRTKLRDLGFDFANIQNDGSFVVQGLSGLLQSATPTTIATSGQETFAFGIIEPNNSFFGVLSALQQNSIAKILAEPTLVTLSGRPAYFQSGGEIPVLIPQGLGNVSVEFRPFGTQVDFVPIVLGDGRVRLEVRPRVSEIDRSLSVVLDGSNIPGFRTREVDTGVEMRIGQTLALAGLIQTRIESSKRGLPWLSDLPYLGVPFRRVEETVNEIELLVLVRPELAEALDPSEVPQCGPGEHTMSPSDCELLLKGHIEVANPHCVGGDCMNGRCEVERIPGDAPAGQPAMPGGRAGAPQWEDVPAPVQDPSARRLPPNTQGTTANRTATRPPAKRQQLQNSAGRPVTVITPATDGRNVPASGQRYNPPATNLRQPAPVFSDDSGEPGLIGPTGYDVIN
jgi:pilus assembly protein CpaC